MMEELRTLWHLLDIHDISIRPRYIESPANVWADRLGRKLDDADGQLNPRIFAYLQRLWGVGRPGWSVVAFRLPRRPGYTSAVAREAVQPSLQYGRDAYCRRFYGASPPPKVWSVSPLEPSANGSVSAIFTEWLWDAYLAAGARPPRFQVDIAQVAQGRGLRNK
eukprot:jgi/Tetstr1/456192/TSEL_042960.t1